MQFLGLANRARIENRDYLEFMPGTSPTFQTIESIELLFRDMEHLFDVLQETHQGATLHEYQLDFRDQNSAPAKAKQDA